MGGPALAVWAVEQKCRLREVAHHSPCGKAVLRHGREMDRVGMPQAAAGVAKTEQERLSQGNKNGQEATGDT